MEIISKVLFGVVVFCVAVVVVPFVPFYFLGNGMCKEFRWWWHKKSLVD